MQPESSAPSSRTRSKPSHRHSRPSPSRSPSPAACSDEGDAANSEPGASAASPADAHRETGKRRLEDVHADADEEEARNASQRRRLSTFSEQTPHVRALNFRHVPWVDWNTWLQLKTLLDRNDHTAAHKLLTLLTLTRRSATPIAVSASVHLLSHLNSGHTVGAHTRRLALAMAITRFVNGMTDLLQPYDASRQAVSVASIAARLQLPPLLVEIRHQASHQLLPPLPTLENGARQALHWLNAHYWAPQLQRLNRFQLVADDPRLKLRRFDQAFAHTSYEKQRDTKRAAGEWPGPPALWRGTGNLQLSEGSAAVALGRMVGYIRDWHKLRRMRPYGAAVQAKQTEATTTEVGGIWSECQYRHRWRLAPIGLIPSQKRVPSIPMAYLVESQREVKDGSACTPGAGDVADAGRGGGEFNDFADDESCDSCGDVEVDMHFFDNTSATRDAGGSNEIERAETKGSGQTSSFEEKYEDVIAQEVSRMEKIVAGQEEDAAPSDKDARGKASAE